MTSAEPGDKLKMGLYGHGHMDICGVDVWA